MKRTVVPLSLLVFLIALSSFTNVGADAVTVGLPTFTSMEVTKIANIGVSQSINISVTEPANGLTPIGRLDFFELQKVDSLGQRQYSRSISMSQPEITWTASSNYNISAFRLPLLSSQISQMTEWVLKEEGKVVVVGQIGFAEAKVMQETTGSLWLLLGSSQTDSNIYTSPYFSLQLGKTYSLILNAKAYANSFSFPEGTVGSPTLRNLETNSSAPFSFDLMISISRESYTQSLDSNTVDWLPSNSGASWLIASYTGVQSLFLPSINITNVEVISSVTAKVNFPSVTAMKTSSTTISASFEINNLPLTQASTEFYLMRDFFWTRIGQTTTDYGGIASINLAVEYPLGNYTLKAIATDGSNEFIGLSTLSVIQPTANFYVSYSSGYYGTGLYANSSVVDVIGTLQASWGVPLEGHEVLLYRNDGLLISRETTDFTGGFAFQFQYNGSSGLYPSAIYLVHNTTLFQTPDYWVDVSILKGTPQIMIENFTSAEFLNESVSFGGSIVKPNGLMLDTTLTLQFYDVSAIPSPQWIDMASTITQNGNFIFNVDNPGVGTFQYRIVYSGDSNFNSVQQTIQLTVNKSFGEVLNVDGLGSNQNPIPVYYNHGGEFSVNITSESGSAISNAFVTVFSPSLNGSSTFNLIASGYSDSNGLFLFQWLPPESFEGPAIALKLSAINPYVVIQVSHENFTIPDKKMYWEFVGLNFSAYPVTKTYYYSFTQTIDFILTDELGSPVKDGTLLTLEINGQMLTQSASNGKVSFSYVFSDVGLLNLRLFYSPEFPSIDFPYRPLTMNLTISVSGADVDITATNYAGLQGGTLDLSSISKNLQGNALPDVTLELWYFLGIWRKVSTPVLITNSSGIVTYRYFVDLPVVGQYSFEWRVVGDGKVKSTSVGFTVDVTGIITDIQLMGSSQYDFSEPQFVTATLMSALNISIENQIIQFNIGGYSWTATTGIDGSVTTQLPLGLLPGTYILNASYQGDTIYKNSSSSFMLTVLGVDTLVSINGLPSNVIYAESLNFTVYLADASNNPLRNQAIRISINGVPYLGVTDVYGKFFFNEVYLGNETTVNIDVFFDGQGGYYASSGNVSLSVIKHSLGIDVNFSDFVYGQNGTIGITVNSTKGNFVSGAAIDIYVDGIYLLKGSTDQNGFFEFVWPFNKPAGVTISIRIIATHPNFTVAIQENIIIVKRASLQVSIDNSTYYFFTNSTIGITVLNQDGNPVQNLLVTISYNYGLQNYVIGQLYTNPDGSIQVPFLPPKVGLVDVLYVIEDLDGNYFQLQGKASYEVQPAQSSIEASIVSSFNFQAGILTRVTFSTTIALEANVTLEALLNGTWVYIQTSPTSNGQTVFSIPPFFGSSSSIIFRATINGYGVINSSTTIIAAYDSVSIQAENGIVESHDIFVPIFQVLSSSGSIEFYYLELYIINPETNSSVFWGNLFNLNGTYIFLENGTFFNSMLNPLTANEVEALLANVNLQVSTDAWLSSLIDTGVNGPSPIAKFPLGVYSLQILFPVQGWYSSNSTTITMTVVPEQVLIDGKDINFGNNTLSLIEIPVIENDGAPVNGGEILIQVQLNGDWITIGQGLVVNGSASITLNTSLPFGTFRLRYLFPKYSYYAVSSVEKSITISKITELVLLNSTDLTIVYSDGVNLTFQLVLKGTLNPLANQTIILSVFENGNAVSHYFGTTNSSGFVIFENVLADLIPGHEYSIIAQFDGTSVLSPATYDLSSAKILRDSVSITQIPEMSHDYGPTSNQTIAIVVSDETTSITTGSIYWTVYYRNAEGVWIRLQGMSGFISLTDQNPVFFVFNMTGEYQLHIEYVNDNPYYFSQEGLVIPFGWLNEMPSIRTTSFSVQFPLSGEISIETIVETVDGNPLVGITVDLWTPFGNYSAITDSKGFVSFIVAPEYAGIVNITFYIPKQFSIAESIIPGSLEITLIEEEFDLSISDIYWDEFVIINLIDPLANNSLYGVQFIVEGEVILELTNLTYSELTFPFQLPISTPATVIYNITRWNSFTTITSISGTFDMLPVPVEVEIAYTTFNGTTFVDVTIIDSRTNESVKVPYALTVINSSNTFTVMMDQYSFSFPASGNTTLTVTLTGRYVGTSTISIISISETRVSDPQNASPTETIPPDLYAILSLALGGMVIVFLQKRRSG